MRFISLILSFTLALVLIACGGDTEAPAVDATPATGAETTPVVTPAEAATPVEAEATPATEETAEATPADEAEEGAEATETPAVTPTTGGTGAGTNATAGDQLTASAQLQNVDGEIVGTAFFTETADGMVTVRVEVSGLESTGGMHGIHFHEVGTCEPDFTAAGEHFNPTGAQHGLENPAGPHAGDLPNLEVDADGNVTYEETTDRITLSPGELSILDGDGTALIIHANEDDQVTDPDGNSGDRILCGVVESGNGATSQ
jgi:superoxide dismutase, Cu-Zn family